MGQEHDAALTEVLAAYDRRFGSGDPGPLARARRLALAAAITETALLPELFDSYYGAWIELPPAEPVAGALAALTEAERLFREAGAPGRAAAAVGAAGVMRAFAGDEEAALTMIGADIAFQDDQGDLRQRAVAQARLALAYLAAEDPNQAVTAQERAEALAAELGDARLAARYALRRGDLLTGFHRNAEAVAAARAGAEFYRTHGPRARAVAAGRILLRVADDCAVAETVYAEVVALGAAHAAVDELLGRGRAALEREQTFRAMDEFLKAAVLSVEGGLAEAGALARAGLVEAFRATRRLVDDGEVAEETLAVLNGQDPDRVRFLIAGLYVSVGAPHYAVDRYDDLARRYGAANRPDMQAEVLRTVGDLLDREGRDAEAAQRFGAAAEAARAAGNHLDELYALRRRLMSLCRAGDVEAGDEARLAAAQRHADLDPHLAVRPAYLRERAHLGLEGTRLLVAAGRFTEVVSYATGLPDRVTSAAGQPAGNEVAGLLGEAMLRCGLLKEAAEQLHHALAWTYAGTKRRRHIAGLLAEALESLGRTEEAAELRERDGA
ncbi:hypothetical protein [Krasilnikovia sp. MM14-A1004]|uniref:hypothetical protein n=1 Tax=Krasilnikovia sp. MM14-A1004 TaxID=3373541 RepID=UPI00399CFCAD